MKTAIVVVRVILGLIYFGFSLMFFLQLMPTQEMSGRVEQFTTGLMASGYLMPLVKIIELICGAAFLTGRFVPLATVVIFPITLNIFLFHGFLAPENMVLPVMMFMANIFLAYAYRANYSGVMAWK